MLGGSPKSLSGLSRQIKETAKVPHGFIQKLLVLYIVAWSVSPPLQVDMKYRIFALICVGAYFFLLITERKKFKKIHVWAVLFAVAVLGIAYIQYGGASGILKPIAIYMLVICFIMNYFFQGHWDRLSGVVIIVLLLLTIWNFKSVGALYTDPAIARLIVRNDVATFLYLRQGIGGYGLIYPQVCIFPAILAWIMKAFRHNFICFVIGSAWLLSYVLYLMEAGYSIAIFASVVGAILLLFHRGKNIMKSFFLAAFIFAGTMCLIVYVDGFRNLLLQIFEGTAVTKKINDLMSTSTTGNAEGSIYIRMALYGESLRTIFYYPFIGGLWIKGGGGHSAVLDAFAKYGIWGGYIYTTMLYYVPTHYKREIEHPLICSISNATLVSLLFVSILDTFSYSFMSMILLVLPLLYEDIIKWEKIKT